VQFLSLKIFRN